MNKTKTKKQNQIESSYNWNIAIGLQKVDNLTTSDYLSKLALNNINDTITIDEADNLLKSYYEEKSEEKIETKEADFVSLNIIKVLSSNSFSLTPTQYINIHKQLFHNVFKKAGKLRNINISKKEWILDGDSVIYADASILKESLEYDFEIEKNFDYSSLNMYEFIKHIAKFISNVWQCHIFEEGNTRTTAVFLIKYLRTFGYDVNNDTFKKHSWYFRNALVRANYNNREKSIHKTTKYLELFLRNLLLNENNSLNNKDLHINQRNCYDLTQSYKNIEESSYLEFNKPCKNITINLINRIKFIRKKKGITQIELAKKCNVPQSTIGRVENFTMTPSLDLILNILNALDIEIELNIKKGN